MSDTIMDTVRSRYGNTAVSGLSSDQSGVRAVAEAFGYSVEELTSIPAEANMGLSCGNPTAWASLKPGEVVLDLGCGGGLDVFLSARKVGLTGKAIGIDMTPEMIALSRRNAAEAALANVEFHQAAIDKLPLANASVDVIISNCVINLAPDKPAVFREMMRVLKPGGRLSISDIALKRQLPSELAGSMMAYVGCVAGAILISDYEKGLSDAGFSSVAVIDSGADLNAYTKAENQAGCCTPSASPGSLPVASGCCSSNSTADSAHADLLSLFRKYNVNDYAASVKIFAMKSR